jgi:putative heme-binding domain-containing protein
MRLLPNCTTGYQDFFLPCCLVVICGLIAVQPALVFAQVSGQKPVVAPSLVYAATEPEVDSKNETTESAAEKIDWNAGPPAHWIWSGNEDKLDFTKRFKASSKSAHLIATCDNVMTVFLNDKQIASSDTWQNPVRIDVQKFLVDGENRIRIVAANQGGVAALALKMILDGGTKQEQIVVTDETWKSTKPGSDEALNLKVIGKMGVGPWGDVFAKSPSQLTSSTPQGVFNVRAGFQVELLYTVPANTQGSWVSICKDNKGRLIASDQGNKGIFRITPARIGSEEPTKVEKLNLAITSAHGMLYAFDSLYLSINGGPGSGLYRAKDTNGDDQFDELTKLKDIQGGGEHGPHALRLSPDGKSIYLIAGNHTKPPSDFEASRLPKNWDEDLLLPRQWDARGHARGILAPGGWIAITDPDGKNWEIFSSGYRNAYDMDFNADGELFAYDADMEWDMGTPWYRPTRAMHATSGSEFGWRSGTGKWPNYYVDSLPELVDIGPGSPVGVAFGYGARFPAKYQQALYLCDWTFGTMYAVHLEPEGASYRGVKEEFVSRTPLPLTDVVIGDDGAMYFTTGGRGTQSELFRVTYTGDESTEPYVQEENGQTKAWRAIRQQMEEFHTRVDPMAAEKIWLYLGFPDRHIRYAARVGLEKQDPKTWQDRIFSEPNDRIAITAAVALARQGDASLEPKLLERLAAIDLAVLPEAEQLEYLRALSLVFIRMGQPDQKTATAFNSKLDAFYPAESDALNRELVNVLVYLNSPTVIGKTLELMQHPKKQSVEGMQELLARNSGYGGTIAKMLSNLPEIQNIHYAFALRNMRYGWTLEQRRAYFALLNDLLKSTGGASYEGFINNIRSEALANLSDAEKLALDATELAPPPKPTDLPTAKGPGKDWQTDEILKLLETKLVARDFENGKRSYAAARCVVCHRFDGNGGATGPDLTNLAGRFSQKDLIEAITEPNKVISDQYRAHDVETISGLIHTGRILSDDDKQIVLLVDPEDARKTIEIPKTEIESMQPSVTSLMPRDLLKPLNEQELLDLLAYLLSRGNAKDAMFSSSEIDSR